MGEPIPLDACAERTDVGPKAQRLAWARRLGLPVPPGVVLPPGVPLNEGALHRAVAGLAAARLAVRSSAAVEDRIGRSAAGLFLSLLGVPVAAVTEAAARVRASGKGAVVEQLLGGPVPVAVLIQPQLEAVRLGVLLLTSDGTARIEERAPEEPEWAAAPRAIAPGDAVLLADARRLAALLAADGPPGPAPPVQVEYALLRHGQHQLLQVRPAPPSAPGDAERWPAPDAIHRYHLDGEHNPDPLSCAQASLVALVDREARTGGLLQRVVRGYLYVALVDAPAGHPPATLGRLRDEVFPACEARLRPLEADDGAPGLLEAVAVYREICHRYFAEIGPSLRRVRGHLDQLLRANLGEGLAQHRELLGGLDTATGRRLQALWALHQAPSENERAARLSAYLADFGALSPCWDVAVACDEEEPGRVLRQAAALGADPAVRQREAEARYHAALEALLGRLPRRARGALRELLPLCRGAVVLGEQDDLLFFRAQRLVRRALRAQGAALAAAGRLPEPDLVFDLPVTTLLDGAPGDLVAAACAARQEREGSGRLVPPERFVAGRPLWAPLAGSLLRGLGVPGRDPAPLRGLVRVVRTLDVLPEDAAGAVLVLPALLPSWAPQLFSAAALVTDSGGALSHGATLAQEAGVPAVVGTGTATRTLRDGDEVIVDAVRGQVALVTGGSP